MSKRGGTLNRNNNDKTILYTRPIHKSMKKEQLIRGLETRIVKLIQKSAILATYRIVREFLQNK